MRKGKIFIIFLLLITPYAFGANNFMPKKFNTVTSHDDVYPYRLNNTKINSNKNTTSTNTINSTSSAPIGKRGVVKRTTNARAATNTTTSSNTSNRRVIPRNNTQTARVAQQTSAVRNLGNRNSSNMVVRVAKPVQVRTTNARTSVNNSSNTRISSQRCFSDYKECMETYCEREDMPYNRCYCSAKLAQIDSKYQNKIDSLVQEIVRLQYNTNVTSDEIKEYWDETVGVYTKDNPWINIENALNIDWPDTQERIDGQNAFNTGHEYCVNNLRACSYMATNLRDAYKSEIARDCKNYEDSLQKIEQIAESVIESYKD